MTAPKDESVEHVDDPDLDAALDEPDADDAPVDEVLRDLDPMVRTIAKATGKSVA